MAVIVKTFSENFVELTCGGCGIIFFVSEHWKTRHWEERQSFYCPNGCNRRPLGETEKERADRLAKELEAAKAARAVVERRLADEQAQHQKELKRIHKRATSGVCQWCHRTFQNVARHMKTKHPEEVL